jgi:hypothetical protein
MNSGADLGEQNVTWIWVSLRTCDKLLVDVQGKFGTERRPW